MLNIKGLMATLALAATPLLAAGAANAESAKLQVGPLATAADVRAFEAKLDTTARAYCADHAVTVDSRIPRTQSCVTAVKAEIMEKLSNGQRLQIAAQGGPQLASR